MRASSSFAPESVDAASVRPDSRSSIQRPSICFVSPGGYGAVSGRQDIARIGGAEVQQTLVARAMVERGFRVRFVSRDHGQADGIDHGGVQVFKMCGPDDGLPGLRFIHPRWTSLIGALRRAAADVYYQRAAGVETGQVAMWCRANGRAFVFAAAVDDDCTPSLPLLRGDLRAKWLYRYGLNRAHRVIGQTRTQISLLRESFGIEATLIRSCSADPLEGEPAKRQRSVDNSAVILWVGRLAEQKRPDRLLDLAEACPTLKFEVVGAANANSRYAQEVQSRGQRLPNVAMRGWVPHESMGDYYSRAALLVCTSDSEGYPNTFMEAWARGLPTVSTVDPDGVVATNGLGAIGPDVASLAGGVRRLLENGCEWQACSQRARRFFLDHHTVTACADAYERLLSELPLGRCPARGVAPKPTVQT